MNKMSFNNEEATREAPVLLSGQAVLDQYATFDQVKFGKDLSKKGSVMKMQDGTIGGRRVFFLSSPTGLLCS
jgi:hypothetical protein